MLLACQRQSAIYNVYYRFNDLRRHYPHLRINLMRHMFLTSTKSGLLSSHFSRTASQSSGRQKLLMPSETRHRQVAYETRHKQVAYETRHKQVAYETRHKQVAYETRHKQVAYETFKRGNLVLRRDKKFYA